MSKFSTIMYSAVTVTMISAAVAIPVVVLTNDDDDIVLAERVDTNNFYINEAYHDEKQKELDIYWPESFETSPPDDLNTGAGEVTDQYWHLLYQESSITILDINCHVDSCYKLDDYVLSIKNKYTADDTAEYQSQTDYYNVIPPVPQYITVESSTNINMDAFDKDDEGKLHVKEEYLITDPTEGYASIDNTLKINTTLKITTDADNGNDGLIYESNISFNANLKSEVYYNNKPTTRVPLETQFIWTNVNSGDSSSTGSGLYYAGYIYYSYIRP